MCVVKEQMQAAQIFKASRQTDKQTCKQQKKSRFKGNSFEKKGQHFQ
jgi:hypothetical protein